MSEDDRETLRNVFAAFAMLKMVWHRGEDDDNARDCFAIADAMMRARDAKTEEGGIVAIKKRGKK